MIWFMLAGQFVVITMIVRQFRTWQPRGVLQHLLMMVLSGFMLLPFAVLSLIALGVNI